MPKILESQHPGEPYWLHWIGNASAIDSDIVKSIGIAWLFKEDDKWKLIPRFTGNKSLFFNALFFIRVSFPCGVFLSLRWSPSTEAKSIFQSGMGWKLNGRFTITLRVQSDKTSAAGVTGPNTGQATGFNYGTH